MIVVHHLNNSRSQRVLWLLEELGLAYEVKRYERDKKTNLAPAALKAIHPLGKSPVLDDGEARVAETGAIIEYLLETYGQGRLKPAAGTPEARRYTYWLHYAEGSAMTPLLLKLIFSSLPARSPFLVRGIVKKVCDRVQGLMVDPNITAHFGYWEAELSKSEWFAGDQFSAADIMMSFPLEAGGSRVPYGDRMPHVSAFVKKIHARPAYQRALERGGPYAYA